MRKGVGQTGKPAETAALGDEVKEMEQRLEELKGFMKQERKKRAAEPRFKDGSHWRSGSENMPIAGYGDRVLNYEKNKGKKLTSTAKP
jgi:hypothetical protein